MPGFWIYSDEPAARWPLTPSSASLGWPLRSSWTASAQVEELVVSVNASRSAHLELSLSLCLAGEWTRPLRFARLGDGQIFGIAGRSACGRVETDGDLSRSLVGPASGFRIILSGRGHLRKIAVASRLRGERPRSSDFAGPAIEQDLPLRSQRRVAAWGPHLCSPSSLSMVLARFGRVTSPLSTAWSVRDRGLSLFGSWSANVAWAGALGLDASVVILADLEEARALLAAGYSLILSEAHGPGLLPASPTPSSPGHLLVLRGFTAAGDVIVADPAAASAEAQGIRRIYPREPFRQAWKGIAYVIGAATAVGDERG